MNKIKTIPFETTDSVEAEKYESPESELQKLSNIREQLSQQTRNVNDDYIAQLKSGLGEQMKTVLSDPEKYMMKPVMISRWKKFKRYIGNIISKIEKVL